MKRQLPRDSYAEIREWRDESGQRHATLTFYELPDVPLSFDPKYAPQVHEFYERIWLRRCRDLKKAENARSKSVAPKSADPVLCVDVRGKFRRGMSARGIERYYKNLGQKLDRGTIKKILDPVRRKKAAGR